MDPVRFQLVIDCAAPESLARFWAAALGYELEAPPGRVRQLALSRFGLLRLLVDLNESGADSGVEFDECRRPDHVSRLPSYWRNGLGGYCWAG
ncbi:MAG TPA: VOC family protein [Mycobacteriales bacterium]|nr:VOC family protein [Mycobacteriales bacterium]